jgi:hypothetical protein
MDDEAIQLRDAEISADEDEARFGEWMARSKLPLPVERWNEGNLRLSDVLNTTGMYRIGIKATGYGSLCPPQHRIELLQEAAQYYTRIRGGKDECVMAAMLRHYR